ncbi:hypothetical protein TCAL_16849 [Tigriopus californicus]|uniref:Uncharacterized protein n=1 Tax=Tigriopus californicus TaxID=6832 RepID=A0A553PDX7_TIGCA|nr:hypothetical protein TCAL_16849 [Tigriopus californicus]
MTTRQMKWVSLPVNVWNSSNLKFSWSSKSGSSGEVHSTLRRVTVLKGGQESETVLWVIDGTYAKSLFKASDDFSCTPKKTAFNRVAIKALNSK